MLHCFAVFVGADHTEHAQKANNKMGLNRKFFYGGWHLWKPVLSEGRPLASPKISTSNMFHSTCVSIVGLTAPSDNYCVLHAVYTLCENSC